MQERSLFEGIKDHLDIPKREVAIQEDRLQVSDNDALVRARELQRDEASGAAARAELQKLARSGKTGVGTAVKELGFLIKERTALLKDDIVEELWSLDIQKRVLAAPPPQHLVDQLRVIQSPQRNYYRPEEPVDSLRGETILETPKRQRTQIPDTIFSNRETPTSRQSVRSHIPITATPSMTPTRTTRSVVFSPSSKDRSIISTPQNASRIDVSQQGLWSPGDLWPDTCGATVGLQQNIPQERVSNRWVENRESAPPERGISAAATASPPPPTPPPHGSFNSFNDPTVVSLANYLFELTKTSSLTHTQVDSAFELLKYIRKERSQ